MPKIVAHCRKLSHIAENTLFHILIHALPILIHWLGCRLSAPYPNTCITYLNTLSRLSAPNLADSSRQPIRVEYYVTRVVSQSESSITSPESSRRLEDPSRLSARVGSLQPILIYRVFHPPPHLISSHFYYLKQYVNRVVRQKGFSGRLWNNLLSSTASSTFCSTLIFVKRLGITYMRWVFSTCN